MVYVIIAVAALIIGALIGYLIFRYIITGKYKEMIDAAEKEANVLKEKKLLEVKEKFINKKSELEKEVQQRNQKIQQSENRLKQREISLNQRQEELGRRRQEIEQYQQRVENEKRLLAMKEEELEKMQLKEREKLEELSGLSADEARNRLVESLKDEARTNAAAYINEIMDEAKLNANQQAKKIVIQTIQRVATETAVENSVSLFDGIRNPDNEEIKYYYPTDTLITAPDIIFFWVARMIMAGEEYRHEVPFHHVYFTGIVRDKLGRKMSKSLGNSPDPIMLIDKYGADGVRMGMLLTAPAGNDIPFDESICEQGRNFSNKIWNALRLIKGWEVSEGTDQSDKSDKSAQSNKSDKSDKSDTIYNNNVSVQWMEMRMAQVLEEIEKDFNEFRLSEALMKSYKLVWDDFCSWYLEMIKPAYGTPIDRETYEATIGIFDRLMRILHPFMPFVTEEIWHALAERPEGASIMLQHMPHSVFYDQRMLDDFEMAREIIAGVRNLRNSKGLSPKEVLDLYIKGNCPAMFNGIICKLGNVGKIESVTDKVEGALSFMVGTTECFVPVSLNIDKEAELKKLNEELKYAEGFLATVMKKLSNEKFVNGAPEKVVDVERQKKADAESKIAALKAQIEALG